MTTEFREDGTIKFDNIRQALIARRLNNLMSQQAVRIRTEYTIHISDADISIRNHLKV